jgi:hypothetical protein
MKRRQVLEVLQPDMNISQTHITHPLIKKGFSEREREREREREEMSGKEVSIK